MNAKERYAANRALMAAGYDPGNHGSATASTYSNWGCRCDLCRAAWAAYVAKRKAVRVAEFAAGQISVPHGLASTYGNYNCRCEPCRRAYDGPLQPKPYPVRYVEPPPPPKVKVGQVCAWLYTNSATSGPDLMEWVGRRVKLPGHPARRRGQTGWHLAALDAIHPDLTCAATP